MPHRPLISIAADMLVASGQAHAELGASEIRLNESNELTDLANEETRPQKQAQLQADAALAASQAANHTNNCKGHLAQMNLLEEEYEAAEEGSELDGDPEILAGQQAGGNQAAQPAAQPAAGAQAAQPAADTEAGRPTSSKSLRLFKIRLDTEIEVLPILVRQMEKRLAND